MLGLIMSFFPYLRSAMVLSPLDPSLSYGVNFFGVFFITLKIICVWIKYLVNKLLGIKKKTTNPLSKISIFGNLILPSYKLSLISCGKICNSRRSNNLFYSLM